MSEPTNESEPRIRGSVVAPRLAYVERRWGDEARQLLLSTLDADVVKRLASVACDGDWFGVETVNAIDDFICRRAGGDISVMREVGAAAGEYNATRIRKQLGTIELDRVVERIGRMSSQFQNFSSVEIEDLGNAEENRGSAYAFSYTSNVRPSHCEFLVGFYGRLVELLNLRLVSAHEDQCPAHGGNTHRIVIWWSKTQLVEEQIDARSVAIYRSAARAPVAGPVSSPRSDGHEYARRRSRSRVGVLAVLAGIALGSWLILDGIELLNPKKEVSGEPAIAPVVLYTCAGGINATVRFDAPEVSVRNVEALRDATIYVEQDGRLYSTKVAAMRPHGSYAFPLSSFRSLDGAAPNDMAAPARIRLTTDSTCECTPR